jgi:outer membrane protein assembly factor BamB
MKPMNKLLIGILLATHFMGCKPTELPPKPTVSAFPIVWKEKLNRTGLTSTPHQYKGNIVFGHPADEVNNYLVYCLDLETGDSIWETRIETPFEFDPFDKGNSVLHNDVLVLADSKRMFALSVENGRILWNYTDPHNFGGICVIDDNLHLADAVLRETSTMHRFNIRTGTKEALFTISHGTDQPGRDFTPFLMMPVKWIHPSGDEILVLQNRSYGYDKIGPDGKFGYSKMDLMAYNLTADSILWYRYEVDNFSSGARPAIDGDKVYFYGDRHAYCINPLNGETLWKYFIGDGPEDDFNTANILIVDDKLIVKPDNDHMHAVNKETGELIWMNNNTASMPGLLTVRNDTIWFSSGGILAIDANTGETLRNQYKASGGSWIFPVAHHPENGYIYTSDASNFYCLDPRYMK